ncbi:MAG TPA: sugar transferase [Candidatus Hydrogenedentes bacterium]|nr:sugar transferase [Candidatus Hydrogenedentota bacterium]
MPPHTNRATFWSGLLALGDTVCVFAATFFASYMDLPPGGALPLLGQVQMDLAYCAAFVLAWPALAARQRLFVSRRRDHLSLVIYDVAKAVVATVIFSGFMVTFFTNLALQRAFLLWFTGGAFVVLALFRSLVQVFLWRLRARGRNTTQVIVIGANPRTKELLRTIHDNPHFGYHVVGILEDEPDRCRMLEEFNIPLLGKFESLEQVLTRHVVDEVFIGLPVSSRYETIQSMAYLCEGVGVGVRLIADLFPLRLATSRFQKLENIPILALTSIPENQAQLLLQRATDIIVSGLALLALSPLLILAAIVIKLDSRGPVFFLQERVGQNQRRFKMVKFRSMVINAEQLRRQVEKLNEAEGPIFKVRRDPRLTRVGRFIRKYSIDELPQLLNVLAGHMSLVGPRPPLPHEVAQYSWNQRRRLSVKPGMTGLSQVRGRSDLSFRETVDLDLAYIDQWSLWLVFRILLQTIPAVLRGRGAM